MKIASLYSLLFFLIITLSLTSCSDDRHAEVSAGSINTIVVGEVVRVKEVWIDVKEAERNGLFSSMATTGVDGLGAANLVTTGAAKVASATGSLFDSKVEIEKAVRVRVRLDSGDLVEVVQLDHPNISFKKGQRVYLTKGAVSGNVWPDDN